MQSRERKQTKLDMIYDFWWDNGGRSSHFLADINAPESVVNRMAEEYNEHTRTISFVTFLRIHNIPARSVNYPRLETGGMSREGYGKLID